MQSLHFESAKLLIYFELTKKIEHFSHFFCVFFTFDKNY